MINYRNIFNPTNNYIGLIIIALLTITIILIKKELVSSIYQISKNFLIAGIILLIINILINLAMNFLIFGSYKVFIQIITNNITKNLYFYSIAIIIISTITNVLIKIKKEK
jgi:hypothetical protein